MPIKDNEGGVMGRVALVMLMVIAISDRSNGCSGGSHNVGK